MNLDLRTSSDADFPARVRRCHELGRDFIGPIAFGPDCSVREGDREVAAGPDRQIAEGRIAAIGVSGAEVVRTVFHAP